MSHTRACGISAHHSTPTARSIRSLGRWSAPLGLRTTTPTRAKLDKLDTVLAQSFTPSQDAALIAEMLSLPNDGRYASLELAAQQQRQKTMEALTTTARSVVAFQSDPNDL